MRSQNSRSPAKIVAGIMRRTELSFPPHGRQGKRLLQPTPLISVYVESSSEGGRSTFWVHTGCVSLEAKSKFVVSRLGHCNPCAQVEP